MDDQRLYLVLNATFSYIVIKYFIWCWTLLSTISWSNISFDVERHFQLYRGQRFDLDFNANFSNIVVEETTDLTQSQWQTYFKDEVSRRTLFDLMHILSWKPIMPIIQRPFLKGQNTNTFCTSIDRWSTNQNRGKGTNQKAPFHKQLTNRNTEWLSNQIRRYERNRPIRYVVIIIHLEYKMM